MKIFDRLTATSRPLRAAVRRDRRHLVRETVPQRALCVVDCSEVAAEVIRTRVARALRRRLVASAPSVPLPPAQVGDRDQVIKEARSVCIIVLVDLSGEYLGVMQS